MSSNVSQSYPYSSESDHERSAAVAAAFDAHEGLEDLKEHLWDLLTKSELHDPTDIPLP